MQSNGYSTDIYYLKDERQYNESFPYMKHIGLQFQECNLKDFKKNINKYDLIIFNSATSYDLNELLNKYCCTSLEDLKNIKKIFVVHGTKIDNIFKWTGEKGKIVTVMPLQKKIIIKRYKLDSHLVHYILPCYYGYQNLNQNYPAKNIYSITGGIWFKRRKLLELIKLAEKFKNTDFKFKIIGRLENQDDYNIFVEELNKKNLSNKFIFITNPTTKTFINEVRKSKYIFFIKCDNNYFKKKLTGGILDTIGCHVPCIVPSRLAKIYKLKNMLTYDYKFYNVFYKSLSNVFKKSLKLDKISYIKLKNKIFAIYQETDIENNKTMERILKK